MISRLSTLALVLAAQAYASPILKRQESPASSAVTVSETATSTATESTQPTASAEPAPAPAPAPEPAPEPAPANPAYPCPPGFLLTYAEAQQTYQYPVTEVSPYVSDFQNASYFGYVTGTGASDVGATRTLMSGAEEVLTQLQTNVGNVANAQDFNLTNGPIDIGMGVMVSNYSNVLQITGNATASPEAPGNVTTAKLFSNFCASDQDAGRMIVMQNFNQSLSNIETLLSGGQIGQENLPSVTQTVQATVVATASTVEVSSTEIAVAPTSLVSETVTQEASTVTASETITPVVTTATELQTSTPEAVTQTDVVTQTPIASTQVEETTVAAPAVTVTAQTTVDPLAPAPTVTEPVTAVTTTTQA